MKKTLITIIISLGSLSIYSQTLTNTTWKTHDALTNQIKYIHFGTDTVSQSSYNINYSNISTFYTDSNYFNIKDLHSGVEENACVDSGMYTFSIQSDTLRFIPVEESCHDRRVVLSNNTWIRVRDLIGIQSTNRLPIIEVYPNPVSDMISIKSNNNTQGFTYIIFDQVGRQVLSGKLTNKITSVYLHQLPTGLYFLQLGEKNKQTIKIMKK